MNQTGFPSARRAADTNQRMGLNIQKATVFGKRAQSIANPPQSEKKIFIEPYVPHIPGIVDI